MILEVLLPIHEINQPINQSRGPNTRMIQPSILLHHDIPQPSTPHQFISLGKHDPPEWVTSSDGSTWTSAFITKSAEEDWETTGYWLTQLMLAEYWKRCWIVQEIGFGLSIQVYAGRKPIPWDSFVELATMFASKHPTSLLPNLILQFQSLREALYQDSRTYVLKELLETFKDSFCSVNLDKILAFASMAVDCWGECLPVDYAGGARPLYEAFVAFQNSIADQDPGAPIEMIHNTGLVRRLLSRRQSKIVKEYKLGWLHQPGTWSHYACGDDDNGGLCAVYPQIIRLLPVMEFLRADYLSRTSLQVTTSIWIADTAEAKETWAPGPGEHTLTEIKTLGAIVGEVREFGPTYHDYLRSPNAIRQWSARLSELYPAEEDRKRTRGLNARLSALLGPAADYRLLNVVNLPPSPSQAVDTSSGPRLFLGGEDIMMGLVPSNAQVGDKLCQFWNSSAVAVLRSRPGATRGDRDGYEIVGRGAMVQHGKEVDWDVPVNKNMFLPGSDSSTTIQVELS